MYTAHAIRKLEAQIDQIDYAYPLHDRFLLTGPGAQQLAGCKGTLAVSKCSVVSNHTQFSSEDLYTVLQNVFPTTDIALIDGLEWYWGRAPFDFNLQAGDQYYHGDIILDDVATLVDTHSTL